MHRGRITLQATILILALLPFCVYGSSGDRSIPFTNCLSKCNNEICLAPGGPPVLPIALWLTRWSCLDNCKYICTHVVTDAAITEGLRIEQFYGKWAFWRFSGMQEPASVLFSLANLWMHWKGLKELRRWVPKLHPMHSYYIWWSIINMNAWVMSSVFHTRDNPITEKLDYFSAALAVIYSLFYTVIRLFHLYPSSPNTRLRLALTRSQDTPYKHPSILIAWAFVCTFAYLSHIAYLVLLPRFDYSYNMAANLVVGIIHNLFWLAYSFLGSLRLFPGKPKDYRPRYRMKPAIIVTLMMCAIGLEVFDFPPWWRIIDAHSLWHASTAPLALLWYTFLVEDSLDDGWKAGRL